MRIHELECQVAMVHKLEYEGHQLECQAAARTQESLSPPVLTTFSSKQISCCREAIRFWMDQIQLNTWNYHFPA